ncbi:hypothetical protein GQ43DRAFT_367081 [Delitschia confertaspora ATCC 74209]|uniref:STB6-like N-terminal domain-containing protein n=1 Tax=Delitschia confertaspora ATCC 74209 TaxID=1513339 RepID=A0A9P4MUR1_9PLEO|nr:hypothetical protein GQ43DRAFT_367081 [Delitschia confertaspora ATCC 74209]
MDSVSPETASTAGVRNSSSVASGHQRFVFTDPVAFSYIAGDPSVTVLARRQKLEGYELYLVEQWACCRNDPTFIITTYTGDPNDSVVASVLSVPTDQSIWSPELRLYFKELSGYYARAKETHLGTLMVTNLSIFPSSLTVIPIPEGDVSKYRELFFVNEDLKRLGCSGRLGIKLAPPTDATKAKFQQLYRTSDKIPLNGSVIELVKLCQAALVLFGKLEPGYADGLLCDVTEKAINDWWVEFGSEYHAVEPHDGILGPTTVAALLGMLMGARNRLSAYNAPVAKDVFDIESTKRGIAYFQKSQRIQRTRRLDRMTLERLRKVTAKAASGEDWTIPRALKSTVAELGGKGGEMVMGMVGVRDKGGIADIETVDLDRFVELVQGERSKWLWYGKPRKTTTGAMFDRVPGEEGVSADDHGHSKPTKKETAVDNDGLRREITTEGDKQAPEITASVEGSEKDPFSKRAALKRATGKLEKAVVGRRHHQRYSKDENDVSSHHVKSDHRPAYMKHAKTTDTLTTGQNTQLSQDLEFITPTVTGPFHGHSRWVPESEASFAKTLTQTPHESGTALGQYKSSDVHRDTKSVTEVAAKLEEAEDEDSSKPPTVEDSVAGSIRGVVLPNLLPSYDAQNIGPLLRRTQSSEHLGPYQTENRNDGWWPRHLSFSIAEESVLTWPSLLTSTEGDDTPNSPPQTELAKQTALANEAKHLRERLALLRSIDAVWVEGQITNVQQLNEQADQDLQELDDMYYRRLEEYHSLREDAHEIISRERSQLQEAIRDIDTLGAKLEYEINTLRSKVDDVDDGVTELERQVDFVEDRVRELEDVAQEKEGWVHWIVRVTTGIGSLPVSVHR